MSQNSSVAREATLLAQRGAVREAHALLEKGMASGDGLAAACLAEWRLSGQLVRRDLAAARDLYGVAAQLGIEEAEDPFIALLANGAGGSGRRWQEALAVLAKRGAQDEWAQRQVRLLSDMALSDGGDPNHLPVQTLQHETPRISNIVGFMSEAECRYLIDLVEPRLQPSVVIHPGTGRMMRDPIRTAKAAGFPFVLENPVLHAINRRIAAATGTSYEQGEPLQVLRYDPGDEYKLHLDTLPSGENQRIVTFLVALNTDFDGGDTAFPELDIRWRGGLGEALQFQNVAANGQPEPLLRHAGLPVKRGTKYLLSKWIRSKPLDLSGPPGRPL
ncbi:MAG: 2OG-Fe(II) oxygenase [Sphingobium sp.]|nr:2OG-Fe(II) oxygenase [Sphingobium sp.]